MSTSTRLKDAATRVTFFLDARSLAALLGTSKPPTLDSESLAHVVATGLATLVELTKACTPNYARTHVASALDLALSPPCPAGMADLDLHALPLIRGGLCSWLHAVDEVESWAHMRASAVEFSGYANASPLVSDSTLLQQLRLLRTQEDLMPRVFPCRSP